MKLNKIQSFIRSRKKSLLLSAAIAPVILVLFVVNFALFGINFARVVKASFGSWADSSLINACVDSRGVPALVSPGTNCNANETQATWLKDIDAGTGLTISRSSSGATLSLTNDTSSGWVTANETWTYASSDAPTFTFTVSGDDTGKYSPGMRVKLTQSSTTEYFIITAVSYSSPNTTVTVYGGTDYTLANATITNPYFSPNKAPQGFPLNPAKWELETVVSTLQQTLSPSANTWYNTGSTSITLPIGVWDISMKGVAEGYKIGGTATMVSCTLSTANNTESDSEMTQYGETATGGDTYLPFSIQKTIGVTSKTTYYLNLSTGGSSYYGIYIRGDYTPLVIRAVSAYL